LVVGFVLVAVGGEAYAGPAARTLAIRRALGGAGFNFVAWEGQALGQKAGDLLTRPGAELSETEQTALVRDYFASIRRSRELTHDIEHTYADPAVEDRAAAAVPLEAELDALRQAQAERRPAVEWILEQQTAAALTAAGLDTATGVFPPVRFQFTESPNILLVSPRDRIVLEDSQHVNPALPLAEVEHIETTLDQSLNASTLIESTGGISTYPTMVVEEPNLEWVLSTIAHEWAHTYLFFRPLGQHYYDSGDTRTLNETAASIIGDELALELMLRFYPELVGPASWPRPLASEPDWWQRRPEDRPFEFGDFMRQTRLETDRLLADGKIEAAEGYMEARRQELAARGYLIRKINQAYFAFHGTYATGPAATDPIGGKLRALRARSASLADFVHTIAQITGVTDLESALGETKH
jgi:hypothetical protein